MNCAIIFFLHITYHNTSEFTNYHYHYYYYNYFYF